MESVKTIINNKFGLVDNMIIEISVKKSNRIV